MIVSGVQIGAPREAGWEDPIGMLSDCHRRIERFLNVLERVIEREPLQTLDAEARSALQGALQYFRVSGVRHTEDEELSLFPRLRAAPEGLQELQSIPTLQNDHRLAERLHAATELLGSKWMSGPLLTEEAEQLRQTVKAHRSLYTQHIEMEDRLLFPAARRLLSPSEQSAMGAEFRQRREE